MSLFISMPRGITWFFFLTKQPAKTQQKREGKNRNNTKVKRMEFFQMLVQYNETRICNTTQLNGDNHNGGDTHAHTQIVSATRKKAEHEHAAKDDIFALAK